MNRIITSFLILFVIFLFSYVVIEQGQLNKEINSLKIEVAELQNFKTTQRLAGSSQPRFSKVDPIYQSLFQINRGSDVKKLLYHQKKITIVDATILRDDAIFELLGDLIETDRLLKIEIPGDPKFQYFIKELKEFGVPDQSTTTLSTLQHPIIYLK